jgi:hypothetical protein
MGRQITVVMNEIDENNFFEYLRSESEIEIYTLHAKSLDKLIHPSLPEDRNIAQFYIWNKSFKWIPSIGTSTTNTPYITNISTAPVIEYMRGINKRAGRLYWDKLPDVSGEFKYKYLSYSYDVEKFEKWYEDIIRWIKKNSISKGKKNDKIYYLQNAWKSGAYFLSIFHKYF